MRALIRKIKSLEGSPNQEPQEALTPTDVNVSREDEKDLSIDFSDVVEEERTFSNYSYVTHDGVDIVRLVNKYFSKLSSR
ncbi:MAG: hypothetical protein QXF12_02290 [Candidatus Aenigmatarchaeota archaeon]